jgi:hypothetical protein
MQFRKLSFNIYEYETFKFVTETLVLNQIEFTLRARINCESMLAYKFKIRLHKLSLVQHNLLKALLMKEEAYDIIYCC